MFLPASPISSQYTAARNLSAVPDGAVPVLQPDLACSHVEVNGRLERIGLVSMRSLQLDHEVIVDV